MLRHIIFTVSITTSASTLATGVAPETSVLLVDEKRGEASINIKNTDDHPLLLYIAIVDLPENNKSIRLIPTQPVIRVEAGQVQQTRFLLQATVPLQSEELKRVTFEGISPKDDKSSRVTVPVHQDLSVLIYLVSLPEERETWKFLERRRNGDQIETSNPSNYVVRMTLQFKTLSSGKAGTINKTYFLSHTSTTTALANVTDIKAELYPISRYGYRGSKYATDLK